LVFLRGLTQKSVIFFFGPAQQQGEIIFYYAYFCDWDRKNKHNN
jgi:hypothetical protein